MNCTVVVDTKFFLCNGQPAAPSMTSELLWERYLQVFDSITVIGRLFAVEYPSAIPIAGPSVSFFALPGYLGPWQYLLRLVELKKRIHLACSIPSAVILRQGNLAELVWQELRNQNRPFAVEVIADPYDTFSPGAIKHCLRPLLRWWAPLQLRRLCREANGALYVTSQALQRRYPCPAYSVGVSDVELSDGAFVSTPRPPPSTLEPFTLIQVGSLNQLYKGPDILIDAVSKCASAGLDIHLVIVGDGKHRLDLEARAAMQGLGNRVRFLGRLPAGKAVRFQLDQADLFVMPSRMEGLPRALLEAMARALPCIASRVGGIPELLAPEDLFPPNDVDALARKIYEVAIDPERQALMSARNLKKAKEYHIDILLPKRIAFYRHIKEMTSEWLQNQRDHR